MPTGERHQFQKTLSLNDFYFSAEDYEFPLGNIQMIGKSLGPMFKSDAPRFAPGLELGQDGPPCRRFWLTTEDLPRPENRVTLNERGEIKLDYTFNNVEPTQRLRQKLQHIVEHADMHPHLIPNHVYLGKTIPIAGVGHQAGTVRFGHDPKTSVLDVHCKAHETGQPLRRRHQLLPQHRRGESVADRDRQCPARWRSPAGKAVAPTPQPPRVY